MAIATVNPLSGIGTYLTNGLTLIGGLNPASTTLSSMVASINSYLLTTFYNTVGSAPPDISLEITSVANNSINGYSNSVLTFSPPNFSSKLTYLANLLINSTISSALPPSSIPAIISDIEDNGSKAGLSSDEQMILFLATQIGNTSYTYFNGQIASPSTFWNNYFSSNAAVNYMSLGTWVSAAIYGALVGASASPKGLITPTTDISSVTIISSLIGALSVPPARIAFSAIPRLQPSQLTASNGIMSGGFSPAIGSQPSIAYVGGDDTNSCNKQCNSVCPNTGGCKDASNCTNGKCVSVPYIGGGSSSVGYL